MIRSRTRTTIWLGLDEDEDIAHYDVHTEDDMLMIETAEGRNEVEVLISPRLFPRITEVIRVLEMKGRHEER